MYNLLCTAARRLHRETTLTICYFYCTAGNKVKTAVGFECARRDRRSRRRCGAARDGSPARNLLSPVNLLSTVAVPDLSASRAQQARTADGGRPSQPRPSAALSAERPRVRTPELRRPAPGSCAPLDGWSAAALRACAAACGRHARPCAPPHPHSHSCLAGVLHVLSSTTSSTAPLEKSKILIRFRRL